MVTFRRNRWRRLTIDGWKLGSARRDVVTRHTATTFDSKNTKECRRAQLRWWLH